LKTIVHVLPYMAKGGTEKHVLTILRGLQNKYTIVLFAPSGEILNEFLKLNIIYEEFPELKGNFIRKVKMYKRVLSEIQNRYDIDIVHIHAAHEFVHFSRKVLPEIPIIFHLSAHQGSALSKMINYKLSAYISRRRANLLIAVSEEEKRIIVKKGYPQEKVKVVYNGYESKEGDDWESIGHLKKKYGLENSLIIGNLGRLNKTKRLDLLIAAFGKVKDEADKNVKLLFIGDGPDRKRLERISHRKGLEKDVIFPGFMNRGDRILKIFDIFVLPTTFEGCSNALVEAMAKGLPILTTDIPSVNWMFENEENAVLFKKNSVHELTEKLYKLISNTGLRKEVGENAFLKFKQVFEAQIMIDKINQTYRALV